MNYYFAFKINPIDAIHYNYPRPHSQEYGVLCKSMEAAQDWLKTADVPAHNQDWMYARYKLPPVNMIIEAAPITANPLPAMHNGSPANIFAHEMLKFNITGMHVYIDADEVHDAHLVGFSQGKDFSMDNLLLRSASSEIIARTTNLARYYQALGKHPEIPAEAMQEWAKLMFGSGTCKSSEIEGYFDVFAHHYQQDVVLGEQYGPQYGVEQTTVLAAEAAARQLYSSLYNSDEDVFKRVLDEVKDEAFPYQKERFFSALHPDNYKAALLEHIPSKDHDEFLRLWNDTMNGLRISAQVDLRKGNVRLQDLSLQTARKVLTEMEYSAVRAQNGRQQTYSTLRSLAILDEVRLEDFDNKEVVEQEEEIEK